MKKWIGAYPPSFLALILAIFMGNSAMAKGHHFQVPSEELSQPAETAKYCVVLYDPMAQRGMKACSEDKEALGQFMEHIFELINQHKEGMVPPINQGDPR